MVTTEVSNKMMLKAMKKRSRVRLIRTKMMKKRKRNNHLRVLRTSPRQGKQVTLQTLPKRSSSSKVKTQVTACLESQRRTCCGRQKSSPMQRQMMALTSRWRETRIRMRTMAVRRAARARSRRNRRRKRRNKRRILPKFVRTRTSRIMW